MSRRYSIVWDGVPQVSGDFVDAFDAMAYGEREYHALVFDADEAPAEYRWDLAIGDALLRLFRDGEPTGLVVERVSVEPIDHTRLVIERQGTPQPNDEHALGGAS
jgi:hypothetical protein